ncbi:MAG: hypothetical protein QM774_03000 [Gordonia sp. (in: high G+C Gram-positive bacteria)]|uniref:hypothetical protein n=1 Tax=Gordonia sp. (in: high G+C Gram-positive bacteria) TaxID=84139 RepID=UPI0039E46A61
MTRDSFDITAWLTLVLSVLALGSVFAPWSRYAGDGYSGSLAGLDFDGGVVVLVVALVALIFAITVIVSRNRLLTVVAKTILLICGVVLAGYGFDALIGSDRLHGSRAHLPDGIENHVVNFTPGFGPWLLALSGLALVVVGMWIVYRPHAETENA